MKLSCLNLKESRFSLQLSASQDKALDKEVLALEGAAIGHLMEQEGILLREEAMVKEAKASVSEKEGNQEKAHHIVIEANQEVLHLEGLGKPLSCVGNIIWPNS